MKRLSQIQYRISLSSVLLAAVAIGVSPPTTLQGADAVPSSIVFQDPAGVLAAWTADGTNVNSANYVSPGQMGNPDWEVVGTGDINGDGSKDYVFQHADGTLGVWYMNGTTVQAAYLASAHIIDQGWRVAAVADFNQDSHSDLLFQHDDGTVGVWLMSRAELAHASILQPSLTGVEGWRVTAAADFDDDGQTDVVFQHTDGRVGIWYMNGLVLKTPVVSPPLDPVWHVVGARDFNGDRKTDLVFQHNDGTVGLWFIDSPTFTAVSNDDGTTGPYSLTWPAVISKTLLNPSQPGQGWRVVVVSD